MSIAPHDGFDRYHRQSLLPGFGAASQQRLAASHAVVMGCGALGCGVADLLARAGVGTLTLIDRDVVEWTNLQRQTLFGEADARDGLPKAVAAANRIGLINSSIRVRPLVADVNPRSVEHLCANADVVIDGTDNFQTRYLVNDACVKHGWPLVYGGVVGTTGMTMTIVPGAAGAPEQDTDGRPVPGTPCLRCVFPDPPSPGSAPTCDTAGVLGPMVAVVAAVQAAEAMKILVGRFDLLRPTLSHFDIWNNHRRTIDLAGIDRGACPCCGLRQFEFLEAAGDATTAICGADSVQVLPGSAQRIDLDALAARLRGHGDFAAGPYFVRGRLADGGGVGLTVFRDARAIVHGTTDSARARSIYARYVGA